MNTHTNTQIYIHTHAHTHMQTHVQTHVHTHTSDVICISKVAVTGAIAYTQRRHQPITTTQ